MSRRFKTIESYFWQNLTSAGEIRSDFLKDILTYLVLHIRLVMKVIKQLETMKSIDIFV